MQGIEITPEVPATEVADLAAAAESAGFDAVFASSHYNNRDPFVALTRAAAATEEVRLGPGVVNPYETHPVTLASRMATLQETADGRGVFGIGAGDVSTLENLGIDRERPLRRVLESFKVAKRLWSGERVDHDGTFVAQDAGLNFDVEAIPVYVGAQGPHMLRMASKHADGVLVNAAHPRDLSWAADRVAEGVAERPARRGDVDVAAFASVSVADDGDAARAAARRPVAFIAAGAPPPVIERHDLDEERARAIGEAIERGDFGTADDLVTPAMIDAFCIAGTPAEAADRIAAALEHVDSFVAASPLGPDRRDAIDGVRRALAMASTA